METERCFAQSEKLRVTLAEDDGKTKRATSSWSLSEKRQLRDFLATRQHLSWSRIAREYEERYHKGRSSSSIAGQAHSMGISPRNKNRKTRGKLGRREHLVLKVPSLPSPTKNASSMESLPDDSLRPPSASALEKANIKETPPQHLQVQEEADLFLTCDLSNRGAVQGHSFDNATEYEQNGASNKAGPLFNQILN